MRSGIEKVGALDLARLFDQDAQGFAGTVQTVGQKCRKRGVQGMMFYSLCQGVDSFVVGAMPRGTATVPVSRRDIGEGSLAN